ncbi:protein of unknown function [Methylorubrum extorquens]|uniref:Uncharacterized protein n=1 Tax=Methylorubrum extorquens TaxID=408 RepID=A0A2N9AQ46_METEX|nr:protein of unknown function [Methylorubrum extorquens]
MRPARLSRPRLIFIKMPNPGLPYVCCLAETDHGAHPFSGPDGSTGPRRRRHALRAGLPGMSNPDREPDLALSVSHETPDAPPCPERRRSVIGRLVRHAECSAARFANGTARPRHQRLG